jgi:predicted CoA-binding protein
MTDDDTIRRVLDLRGAWAVVGWSPRPERPSHEVAAFLESIGHPVVRVNPEVDDPDGSLGVDVVPSLADIGGPVSVVDVFRRSSQAGTVIDQAIAVGARAVWLQLGVFDDAATERARRAGLEVVVDRCPKIEHPRLFGR